MFFQKWFVVFGSLQSSDSDLWGSIVLGKWFAVFQTDLQCLAVFRQRFAVFCGLGKVICCISELICSVWQSSDSDLQCSVVLRKWFAVFQNRFAVFGGLRAVICRQIYFPWIFTYTKTDIRYFPWMEICFYVRAYLYALTYLPHPNPSFVLGVPLRSSVVPAVYMCTK